MKEVATYPANPWDLHDMLGLVFEWCLDAYAPTLPPQPSNPYRPDPPPGTSLQRLVRGGCYQGPDTYARASARAARPPEEASHRIGFRVVLAQKT